MDRKIGNVSYILTRAKRKSISIIIRDGTVTVKAPIKAEIAVIEKFLTLKQNWIIKKLAEHENKRENFSDILSFEKFVLWGNYISCPSEHPRKLLKFLKNQAQDGLGQRIQQISKAIGVQYKSFKLSNAKTKWGSCDGFNNISLNWRLVLLNTTLVDYVIVHELCHVLHHDHSPDFWNAVAKILPGYKIIKKQLKQHSLLITYLRESK